MSDNTEMQPSEPVIDLFQMKKKLLGELANLAAEVQHKVGQIALVDKLLSELHSPPPRS